MRFPTVSAIAFMVGPTMAYLDTSPLFLLSSSAEFDSGSMPYIQTADSISNKILANLANCPTKNYMIVTQPGVTTADYSGSNTPSFERALDPKAASSPKTVLVASEILGRPHVEQWRRVLESNCKVTADIIDVQPDSAVDMTKSDSSFRIVTLSAPSMESEARVQDMSDRSSQAVSIFDQVRESGDYTIIYVTNTHWRRTGEETESVEVDEDSAQYVMQTPLDEIPHLDLKRDVGIRRRAKAGHNQTMVDGPLFHRYQFFTPGLFMGLAATIPLLLVLYVGISALTSLQVTYAAFDKDNGPLASKKAQ